jgi:hypothetical protein
VRRPRGLQHRGRHRPPARRLHLPPVAASQGPRVTQARAAGRREGGEVALGS